MTTKHKPVKKVIGPYDQGTVNVNLTGLMTRKEACREVNKAHKKLDDYVKEHGKTPFSYDEIDVPQLRKVKQVENYGVLEEATRGTIIGYIIILLIGLISYTLMK